MTAAGTPKGVELAGITKSYGRQRILHGLDLDVAPGEFVSMLGPSGSGKTTVLKVIAGFEEPDGGTLRLGGIDMAGIAPERRNIGVVFQNYSLFPHMSVAANVMFPLRMRGMPKDRRIEAMHRALALVALSDFETRMPNQLSGGQQQRVAIARAIVYEPDVLLMDEPLGALDRRLRGEMQLEIKALHERLGITIVYVTHDQDEALSMSDRVVVFNRGRVEQIGKPREVYRRPATSFVADFLGDSLSIAGEAAAQAVRIPKSDLVVPVRECRCEGAVRLLWRSDQVAVIDPPSAPERRGDAVVMPAEVLAAAYAGTSLRLRVRLPTGDVGIVVAPDTAVVHAGDRVGLVLDPASMSVLAASEDKGK